MKLAAFVVIKSQMDSLSARQSTAATMKNLIFLFLFWIMATAASSQGLPFPGSNGSLQNTNLKVRWEAPKHPWPKTIWTYQMVPTKFPVTLISNLMSLDNFTERDRWGSIDNTNGIAYFNFKNSLSISFATGEIEFGKQLRKYSPTNLAEDVPAMNQLYGLTTNFLPKLGINYSEIPKKKDGQLQILTYEPLTGFPGSGPNGNFLTNIEDRCASFGRLINGLSCDPDVGSCSICYGEHGQIIGLHLFWRNVERSKLYPSATPKQIVQQIREGKAILPSVYCDSDGREMLIDWSKVKKITVKAAAACYWGEFFFGEREHRPIFPSPVIPYANLKATIDTGTTNVDVQIKCRVIDETNG